MADITRILSAIEAGDPRAAAELLPLVYDELRKLAAARLADERPGQTLQPTALVHEAYLRLVADEGSRWNGRGHFFAAEEPAKAELVQIRFFAGLTIQEAADALGVSVATAERWWAYARTWLFAELEGGEEKSPAP